jgi:hypothetical protein
VQTQFESYQLPLHLRLPLPAVHVELAAVPAKAEGEPETLAAALVAAAIDRACEAAEPSPVVAPEPAPVVYSELARVGQRVSIDGYFGVVWKVTKKHVAVAYDDESWQHMSHAIFSNRVFKELSFSVETGVAGVLQTQVGTVLSGSRRSQTWHRLTSLP